MKKILGYLNSEYDVVAWLKLTCPACGEEHTHLPVCFETLPNGEKSYHVVCPNTDLTIHLFGYMAKMGGV